MATTPDKLGTWMGTLLLVVELLPSWPDELRPQAQTVPSALRARLCAVPPAMLSTPVRPEACTGTLLVVVVLLPSWPLALLPHAHTVPSAFRPRVCVPPRPAVTATMLASEPAC